MTYKIELESFCDEIFNEMERIQDGGSSHTVRFKGVDREDCTKRILARLQPFINKSLEIEE